MRYYYTRWSRSFALRLPIESDAQDALEELILDGQQKLDYFKSDASLRDNASGYGTVGQNDSAVTGSYDCTLLVSSQVKYLNRAKALRLDRLTPKTRSDIAEEKAKTRLPTFTDTQYSEILEAIRLDLDRDEPSNSARERLTASYLRRSSDVGNRQLSPGRGVSEDDKADEENDVCRAPTIGIEPAQPPTSAGGREPASGRNVSAAESSVYWISRPAKA